MLQDGLPVCSRPFARIAKDLDCDEQTVLQQIKQLKDSGVIRRFRAMIDYRALGMVSTLVTAHVSGDNLRDVADAVNSLDGVSHNYCREHFYNLWFTLQAQTDGRIEIILNDLSSRFNTEFHSLPVECVFKLDVRFDADSLTMRGRSGSYDPMKQMSPDAVPVELDEVQKQILLNLQDELELTAEPFDFSCGVDAGKEEILKKIQQLIDLGVIRRIAAVVDHRRLGFAANVMFVCEVPRERIVRAGECLAGFGTVSHCYQRRTFYGWPYNLFAMMHGADIDRIRSDIDEFVEAEKIDAYELLPTVAELKKQPVWHDFC